MSLPSLTDTRKTRMNSRAVSQQEQHSLMDESIKYIKEKNFEAALESIHKLEAGLGLPAPDEAVRLAQIPGGMYSNMLNQLKGNEDF